MSSLIIPTPDSFSSQRMTTLTINSAAVAAPSAYSPTTPLSPSAGDVRQLLSQIQFVAHKSSNLVHSIAVKEAQLVKNPITEGSSNEKDGFAPPARSFSCLPETVPVGELDSIKSLLEDIWQATVPLTGAVYFLGSASLLLRNRLYSIVRDVARYLEIVAGELQGWLGEGGDNDSDENEPLTPVSMDDDNANDIAAKPASTNALSSSESIPPSHISIVLDVMLALLEASSGMLAAMSRMRTASSFSSFSSFSHKHVVDESKEAASRSLDRARFQTHMYRPENEGLSTAYADADRLGFRALEEHVASLTSYLWCDFGSSSVGSGW
jgi:hypothetical protein